jgi:Protein of unknown function
MNSLLDNLILSSVTARWKKVAKIITVVSDRAGDTANLKAIAARICALVDKGKLEGKGDLSRWGHSEVRRDQSSSALGLSPERRFNRLSTSGEC